MKTADEILAAFTAICDELRRLPIDQQITTANAIKEILHEGGPFRDQPVDCVQWVPADSVTANTYNPNRVAPPEMKLLELSIMADGFTQPIVANEENDGHVVVDGFHRNRVGKESAAVRARVMGYLPIVQIRSTQGDVDKRMASTIRHNRARGKHQVDAMTDIVLELSRRNWTDKKIARELGMDADEVLRFKQIGGLADLFSNREFSEAWEIAEDHRA